MSVKNLEVVLTEANEILKLQHDGIDLLYNKLNWILVSDLVFIAAICSRVSVNPVVTFLILVSTTITLFNLLPEKFNYTAQITSQLSAINEPKFLEGLIAKKVEAFNSNTKKSKRLHIWLLCSSSLLLLGIALQFILIMEDQGNTPGKPDSQPASENVQTPERLPLQNAPLEGVFKGTNKPQGTQSKSS